MVDYYKILDISKDATEADIKKAYRKQALKWHPDKNPDNKEESEAQFKSISEAYEVLSDKDKRSVYDRYGKDGLSNGGSSGGNAGHHFTFHDPNDIFKDFFGGRDPFAHMFEGMSSGVHVGGFGNAFDSGFRGHSMGAPGFSFGTSFNDFGDFGGGSASYSFSSSSGGGGGGRNKKSVTKTIKQVNGQKIETKKIVQNGNERVEVRKNGKITSVKINGIHDDEQLAVEQSKEEMEVGNNKINDFSSYNNYSSYNNGYDDQGYNNRDIQKAVAASLYDDHKKNKHGKNLQSSSKHEGASRYKFW